ncbi:hypothetical protein QLX08_002065 [Tetragonisca angustula]|uniref:Helicase/UvrB N-terminal domain-containing protein n=1 Tax=Tetragonisca angustula TaxID=166442 RepID=A0AAW1AFJ6_9HYME
MQELIEKLASVTISKSNCPKCDISKVPNVNNLTKYQRKVYNNIQQFLKENNRGVITIDTPSGTGKTFLLCTLAKDYQKTIKFIIFRKDQASKISLWNIQTYTFVSFLMHHFNLKYENAIEMFRTCDKDNITELYKLIVYSKKFVAESTSIIILDIYTIPSPTMLLLLYIISLQHKLYLIFAGNRTQLDAINKSVFHKENNFYIVQILNDLTINKLADNIRTCDNMLENEVSCFHKRLLQIQPAGNIPFYYDLRYYLYTLFRSKYFAKERFDTIYIAQTHQNIRKRLYRLIDYCESNGRPYYEAPFYYENTNGNKVPLPKCRKGKFFPTLLLVEGYKYIYIDGKGVHHVVLLENVFLSNFEVRSLKIRFIKDDRIEKIQRIKLNYYQILPAYRKWLMDKVKYTDDLWQFPLRPYTLTYHATLGQTLEKEQVELNADCRYANFLYIGLSCIRHKSDIHKIHDQNVAGYLVTEYMETVRNDTTYYYRCEIDTGAIYEYVTSKQPVKYIDNIEWTTVNDVKMFESVPSSSCYWRIKRSIYEKSNEKVDTSLMQVARFVKENPDVIINAMKKAPANDLMINDNNKKKMKEQKNKESKKSDAYNYLRDQYDQWVVKNELNLRQ